MRWWARRVALLVVLVSSPAWAQDGGPADAGALDASVAPALLGEGTRGLASTLAAQSSDGGLPTSAATRLRDLTQQGEALETLVAGGLDARLTTSQLFQVDLRDEAAVARRRDELARLLAATDGGAATPEAQAERRVLAARLAFLSQPAQARQLLLDAEANVVATSMARLDAEQRQVRAADERRAAELAQQAALELASQAEQAERRLLATELAHLQAVRAEQATMKEANAARRGAVLARREAQVAAWVELQHRSGAVADASPQVDALFDAVILELQRARGELRAELADLGAAVTPAPRVELAVSLGADLELDEARAELRTLAAALNEAADPLENEQRQLAFDEAEAAADQLQGLSDLRLSLLARLTTGRAAEVRGLGRAGRAELATELEHLELMARWRRVAEGPILRRWLGQVGEPLVLAEVVLRALALLVLVAVTRFLSRRISRWLRQLRGVVVSGLKTRALVRWLLALLDAVSAVAAELTVLGALLLVAQVIAPLLERPALAVLWTITIDFAIYRLAIRVAHGLIGWLAWSPLGALSEGRSDRALRSVRLVGRYIFAVDVLLVLSHTVLGQGLLYSLVLRFSWLGALPLAAVLMRWWKQDISDAYLRVNPEGALAGLVKRSRDRTFGFFVALAAFVVIFFAWLAAAARRFVMRFDQTRKALAYVFRRRLERRAGESDDAEVEAAPLPPEVLAVLRTDPVAGEKFTVDRFPQLTEFLETVAAWREGDAQPGAWLVVGRTGLGKTSWLNAAVAGPVGVPLVRIDLQARLGSVDAFVRALADAAQVPATTLDELATALLAGPRRLFVIDDLQNLVLRGQGQLAPWDALTTLMQRVGSHVFWLGAIAYQPFHYLQWARQGQGAFRRVVRVARWSEAEIFALLDARTSRSGWTVSYDGLLVTSPADPFENGQVVQTGQEFTRLIWDFAEGSPRVALDCWARSLVPDGARRLRVRLFARPDEAVLDALDEVGLFALGAVAWHENVDVREAALSLQLPEARCDDALRRLTEAGVLERQGSRLRIAVAWWPVVMRFLVRKHLILN